MEWKVSAERQDEVLEFYTSYVAPKVSSSPDVLRLRMFEVDNATVLQGTSYETKEKNSLHTYFTLVEFETDDWPWEAVIELAENPDWRKYFEAQKLVVSEIQICMGVVTNTQIEVATESLPREKIIHCGRQCGPRSEP